MLKKVLIGSIIFFVLAVGFTSYMLFFRKSTPEGTSPTYQPFGQTSGEAPLSNTSNPNISTPDIGENSPINVSPLMRISREPAAGGIIIQSGQNALVRYTLRATGHINETNLRTGTSSRVANTTIPKLYESLWFPGGNRTLMRYLNDSGTSITTYDAEFVAPKSTTTPSSLFEVRGSFLSSGITTLAISPDAQKIFFLQEDVGKGIGFVSDAAGLKRTQIFNSPLKEWTAEWPSQSQITLTTKPTYITPGYIYSLNPTSGSLKKIFGGISGLTTKTNPTSELIAFADNTMNLKILTAKTGVAAPTNLSTLPEKCVWSKADKDVIYCAVPTNGRGNNYPDTWYQGSVSFTDDIYKIDTKAQKYYLVAALQKNFGASIDAINLSLSSNGDYLLFSNKKDDTLWSLSLTQ